MKTYFPHLTRVALQKIELAQTMKLRELFYFEFDNVSGYIRNLNGIISLHVALEMNTVCEPNLTRTFPATRDGWKEAYSTARMLLRYVK